MCRSLIFLVLACLTLAACGKLEEAKPPQRPGMPVRTVQGAVVLDYSPSDRALVRIVDPEARVVCYRIDGGEGLSCLPMAQTALDTPGR